MWQTALHLLSFTVSHGIQVKEATFNSAIPVKGGLWMTGLGGVENLDRNISKYMTKHNGIDDKYFGAFKSLRVVVLVVANY